MACSSQALASSHQLRQAYQPVAGLVAPPMTSMFCGMPSGDLEQVDADVVFVEHTRGHDAGELVREIEACSGDRC